MHKTQSDIVNIADKDAFRIFQPSAEHTAYSRRTRARDEYVRPFFYVRYFRRPEPRREYVAREQSLSVRDAVGDDRQSAVRVRDADVFRLHSVYAASQCPSAVGKSAVVHPAALAEKAFAAESFHIHGHTVARFHFGDLLSRAHDFAHRFVSDRDAFDRARHAAVHNVQVAGADA